MVQLPKHVHPESSHCTHQVLASESNAIQSCILLQAPDVDLSHNVLLGQVVAHPTPPAVAQAQRPIFAYLLQSLLESVGKSTHSDSSSFQTYSELAQVPVSTSGLSGSSSQHPGHFQAEPSFVVPTQAVA